jgi:hypothetical protein
MAKTNNGVLLGGVQFWLEFCLLCLLGGPWPAVGSVEWPRQLLPACFLASIGFGFIRFAWGPVQYPLLVVTLSSLVTRVGALHLAAVVMVCALRGACLARLSSLRGLCCDGGGFASWVLA